MLLQATGIGKSYGTTAVLHDISIQIQERDRIGLVGVNGAGKSTLLKILAGEMSRDSGEIFKAKEARIGYLAQQSGWQSDRSIWAEMLQVFEPLLAAEQELRQLEAEMAQPEPAAEGKKFEETLRRYAALSDWFRENGGYETEAKIRGVLHGMGFADLPPDTPVSALSGGQKTRLALARLLLQSPELLMLDEPTNYLDIPTLTWLESYLRGYPGAVLVVSHDRYFLDALVTGIVEIERHRSRRYTGNYSRYIERKAAEYEIESRHYEKQQEEIARMEDFIRRNLARASTTKRAQSRRKALERMERLDKPQGELKRASFTFEVDRISGKEVLDVHNLAVSVGEGRTLFRNVSFHLRRGETVALIGPNGIGKSTLLKTLIGEQSADQGRIEWGTNVKIGYYDQEQTQLNPNHTVLDEVWNAYPHLEEVRIRTVLGNFLFSGEDVLKKVASLSGGEKARVALAKLMLKQANVLILDEPTNHLDLFSKEVLEAALMDYEGTLLFISHDRYFLNKLAERVLELDGDGATAYLGNYDDYLEKKRELAELAAEQQADAAGAAAPAKSAGAANSATARPAAETAGGAKPQAAGGAAPEGKPRSYEEEKLAKREERNRQRRIEQLERQIAQLEDEIAEMEAELMRPDIYNDYVLLQQKSSALDEAKAELDRAYAEWESLMS